MTFSPLARAEIRASKIEAIQQQVARIFGLRVEELKQRSRTQAVTMPRQMAMYLAKQVTDASLMPKFPKLRFTRLTRTE
jgi:chromosomal replication initiation ATPase DnaA